MGCAGVFVQVMVAVPYRLYPLPQEHDVLDGPVTRRHILYVQGFFPKGAAYYHALLCREITYFAALHGVKAQCGALQPKTELFARCEIEITNGTAELHLTYDFLTWVDLIHARLAQSPIKKLFGALQSIADHFSSGALRKIIALHWRYALSLAAPYIVPLMGGVFLIAAAFCLITAARTLSFTLSFAGFLSVALAVGAFALARSWRAPLMRVNFAACADYARGRWPELDQRADAFAGIVQNAASTSDAQEILVVAHSFGTQLAALALARSLYTPAFMTGKRIGFLSLADISCHIGLLRGSGAEKMRRAISQLGTQKLMPWAALYSGKDVLCFNTAHPPATLGCEDGADILQVSDFAWPVMHDAGFRSAMDMQSYRRRRLKFFHMHSQFIYAARKKDARFDYVRAICSAQDMLSSPLFSRER